MGIKSSSNLFLFRLAYPKPPPSSLLKILQNDQLDEISPLGTEEVSAVSQAWFTTKEDKDSLTNKGKAVGT